MNLNDRLPNMIQPNPRRKANAAALLRGGIQ
ncbi:hypothetical protein FHW64_004884 [Variovorax sp. Sphag1AA]|nr:hypothetical protein [Variovorax sp. Sphag1AA]